MHSRLSTWIVLFVTLAAYHFAGALPISSDQRKESKPIVVGAAQLLRDGYQHLAARELAAASKAFEAVLKENRTSVDAMLGLAAVAKESADSQTALEWAERAVRVAPDDLRALYGEARLMLDLGDAERALARLQRARIKFPQDIQLKLALAEALSATARDSEAGAVLEQALQLSPADVAILHALGLNYLTRNRADSATKIYDRLLTQNPEFGPGWIGRGDALSLLQRDDQALAAYRKAVDTLPAHALPKLKLAVTLERLKRYDEAERSYLDAIKLDPKSAFAYNNLAYLSAQRGQNLDQALNWAKQAVALNGKLAAFHDTLGWVYWIRGDKDAARAALNKALTLDPAHPGVRKHLAKIEAGTVGPVLAARRSTDLMDTVPAPSPKPSAVAPRTVEQNPTQGQERAEASSDAAKSVRRSMNAWRAAWQAKDIERYLSFYAGSFVPTKGARENWIADRRLKLGNTNEIRIDVSGVEVAQNGQIVETRFNQDYAASHYQDKTRKTLQWIKEEGQWRIQREIQTPR